MLGTQAAGFNITIPPRNPQYYRKNLLAVSATFSSERPIIVKK
jgi:hypothetical protein